MWWQWEHAEWTLATAGSDVWIRRQHGASARYNAHSCHGTNDHSAHMCRTHVHELQSDDWSVNRARTRPEPLVLRALRCAMHYTLPFGDTNTCQISAALCGQTSSAANLCLSVADVLRGQEVASWLDGAVGALR